MEMAPLASKVLRPLVLGALVVATSLAGARAAEPKADLEDFRTRVQKWVETRQILSKEKSDWEVEKETLGATRDLLAQQKTSLEEEIKLLDESGGSAEGERRELLLQRGEFQRVGRTLEEQIRGMEEAVLAIVPRLPRPLQEKLQPLLVQIPDDPAKTKSQLGQRLVNVLGILAQAEKFNSTATLVGETRSISEGSAEKVQVRTLYWGLGEAIYVDSRGEVAGIGRPGAEGWEFSDDPALASEAKLLLDVFEGNVDVIEFVEMPVEIR
jgi:hypothetical protein